MSGQIFQDSSIKTKTHTYRSNRMCGWGFPPFTLAIFLTSHAFHHLFFIFLDFISWDIDFPVYSRDIINNISISGLRTLISRSSSLSADVCSSPELFVIFPLKRSSNPLFLVPKILWEKFGTTLMEEINVSAWNRTWTWQQSWHALPKSDEIYDHSWTKFARYPN